MNATRRNFLVSSLAGIATLQAQSGRPRHFAKFETPARALLAGLSLEQKIGQMTQPDQMYLKSLDDIEKYHLGSLLSGGDSDPKSGNDLISWTDMYDRYQERALKTETRIPLLYGVDSVHGHNNVIGAVVFPHNVGLGCTRNAKLVEQSSRITGEEVRATGINWGFSPCVTVPQDIRWGRTYEGYSESPDVVKELGEAATRGLQRASLADPLAVLACAKHYAADGGTTFGTGMPKGANERYPLDRGDVRMDEASLKKLHLQGYLTSIRAGVGTIMPSYSSWNGEKCSGNKRLLTGILKEEFGFEGFLISDYNALDELPGSHKDQIEKSINAGMDMVMVPERYVEFYETLLGLVKDGKVPQSRIDDAVLRILKTKFALGLMDPKRSHLADRGLHKNFGSPEHRAVARQCVRESVVVLKNDGKTLPLKKAGSRVHVAGVGADDIGIQCGGWTIKWQGAAGPITKGTTILEGMKKTGAQVTFSKDGSGAEGAAAVIAVIGETTPYAEFFGDRTDLNLSAADVALVSKLKASGVPVVAVILSGRPLIIDEILDKVDAIVAAWLPGTEGDGVADVLFGDAKPKGKLGYTWPSAKATSLNRSDPGYKTLYPFGHGLTY